MVSCRYVLPDKIHWQFIIKLYIFHVLVFFFYIYIFYDNKELQTTVTLVEKDAYRSKFLGA